MKIEIERDVLQNALEALQYAHATNRYENTRQDKAIKELRKALASPTEIAETLLMAFDGAPFVQAQGCLSGVSVTQPVQQGWCSGCNPGNCQGCGGAPGGFHGITKGT